MLLSIVSSFSPKDARFCKCLYKPRLKIRIKFESAARVNTSRRHTTRRVKKEILMVSSLWLAWSLTAREKSYARVSRPHFPFIFLLDIVIVTERAIHSVEKTVLDTLKRKFRQRTFSISRKIAMHKSDYPLASFDGNKR